MAVTVLQISALYIYPVKSLRGILLQHGTLTAQGLNHDRRFMLREVMADGSRRNMACYHDPIMVRFMPSLARLDGGSPVDIDNADALTVHFMPIDGSPEKEITFPLSPDTTKLKETGIMMHGSPTTCYEVGQYCDEWFSDCFGKDVELIFVGHNRRKVYGNLSPNPTPEQSDGILSAISNKISNVTGLAFARRDMKDSHEQGLALSDVAPLLIVNQTSLNHITRLLPGGMQGDVTKFRPNIVISGAAEDFCEDYWRELSVQSTDAPPHGHQILLTQNCTRCTSLNIDYDTGDFATGAAGRVLAKLSKDRRVDSGAKSSPVFGRYGFVHRDAHGKSVSMGDAVAVTGVNAERTAFCKRHPFDYVIPTDEPQSGLSHCLLERGKGGLTGNGMETCLALNTVLVEEQHSAVMPLRVQTEL